VLIVIVCVSEVLAVSEAEASGSAVEQLAFLDTRKQRSSSVAAALAPVMPALLVLNDTLMLPAEAVPADSAEGAFGS
jgi:hypothetical protein